MESTAQNSLKKLREPFPSAAIEWRVGRVNADKSKGVALPYLKFHALADRLDEVLGPQNWRPEYVTGPAGGVVCRLSLRIGDEWIAKENGADNTDLEAVKGGLTDAFKRACATWGLGRYLYAYPAPWVPLDEVRRLTLIPRLPDDFLPENERGQGLATEDSGPDDTASTTESSVGSANEDAASGQFQQVSAPADTSVSGDGSVSLVDLPAEAEQKPKVTTPAGGSAGAEQEKQPETTDETLPGLPGDLDEAEIGKIRAVLDRVGRGVPVERLVNYVDGRGKDTMSETARQYVLKRLKVMAA